MPTPFFGQQIAGSTGRTDLPKLRRDYLIDDGCKGLFDFGRKWGYAGQASPAAAAAPIRPYRREGTPTTVIGTPTWTGGMMNLRGAGQKILLPAADWLMTAAATSFSIGGFFKIFTSGFTPLPGSGTASADVFVACQANGANAQYRLNTLYDTSGNVTKVYLGFNGSLFDVTSVTPMDNAVHHYAISFLQVSPTTWQGFFYVDGVLVYTTPAQNYSGALVVPTSNIGLGAAYTASCNCAVGRIWLWDHSVAGVKAIAALLAADIAQNGGRFN
ncbi:MULTISPECIES: hypothetical protein [unclassified Sphingomonas]|uniref:hypothetical protein n=1 Tax=Novosphingobium rhizosphaerae TaxID=1551649 RepID=UPI0015CCEA3B